MKKFLLFFIPGFFCFHILLAATFTVTNTNDTGAGSLRDAITQSNLSSGNTINFNIPGAGPYIINVTFLLPSITSSVIIDGNTQPSATPGFPKIVIRGATWEGIKLDVGSNGSTVRGLAIYGNGGCGIQVFNSSNHIIEGNYIGTDPSGVLLGSGNNLHGIQVINGTNITIGGTTSAQRNVIVGAKNNDQSGISLETNSSATIIGNYIGVGSDGKTRIKNGLNGVMVQSGSRATIGGASATERNIISGNSNSGIYIVGAAANSTVISGNYIGTDFTGTNAVVNGDNGITVETTKGVTIGGGAAGAGNLVSGNNQSGISVRDGSDNAVISGNIVGLGINGTTIIANGQNGIHISSAKAVSILNNVVTGNLGSGISLVSKDNTVANGAANAIIKGNIIGLAADGNTLLPNGNDTWGNPVTGNKNAGIYTEYTTGITIGGPAPADANTISGNAQWGVELTNLSSNALVQGNFIGVNKTGTQRAGNNYDGVFAKNSSSQTIIQNVISGNNGRGIFLENNSGSSIIKNNLIGLNAAGSDTIGNKQSGIRIVDSDNTTVGGVNAADRNYISGNWNSGIEITSSNNLSIYGNYIGTDITAARKFGNYDSGISVFDNYSANDAGNQNIKIGGLLPGQGNIIANSSNKNNGGVYASTTNKNGSVGQGVFISDALSKFITVTGNNIYCNADRGIDLNGPKSNNAIKAPVVDPKSTSLNYFGTAVAGHKIDIYTGDNCYSCGDAKRRQQGKTYITTVIADGAGKWSYTNANSTNLVATATDANGNTSEFSVAPVPNAVTVPGQTCGNKPYTVTGATTNGNPFWKTSGDGTFDNTNILLPVYTPGTNDKSAVSVTLTLTDSSFCSTATKTLVLTINKADVGTFSIADYCEGKSSTAVKGGTTSAGNFSLKSLTGSGTATINANTGLVSGGAGNDTYEITYTTLGVCPAIGKDSLVVISVGSVNFTIADYCEGRPSPKPVFSTPPPTPGTFSLAPATATIDNLGVITGGVAGTTYTVTYTYNGACIVSGSNTVKVKALPVVSVASATICNGQSKTLTATGTGTSFLWSPSTGLNNTTAASVIANPTSTTVYKIVATTNGCVDSTNATLTVNPLPLVTVTNSTVSVCSGSSTTLTAGGNAAQYTWTGGTLNGASGPSATVSPTSNTNYKLKGTTNGCSDSANVLVKVNSLPVAQVTPNNPNICIGGSVTLTVDNVFTAYSWSAAPTDPSLTATTSQAVTVSPVNSTTYTVVVTDANTCTKSFLAVVNVLSTPLVSVTPDQQICFGDTAHITASGANTYSWTPVDGSLNSTTGNTVIAKPAATTKYTVTGRTTGCTDSPPVDVTITVNSLPVVTATVSPNPICKGQSATLTANGGSTYQWNPDPSLSAVTGNSITATPGGTMTYLVLGTDVNNCKDTSTVKVVVNSLPVIVSPDDQVCYGLSKSLTATGAATYSWSAPGFTTTTGSTITASPVSTTTYKIVGTDANNCSSTKDVILTVNPLPVLVKPADASICTGLSASLQTGGAATYQWSPAAGLSSTTSPVVTANPTATTPYKITGTTAKGCIDSTSVTVKVNPLPVITPPSPVSICSGKSASLTASSVTATSYTWIPSSTPLTGATVTVSPVSTTPYTIEGTDANGCKNTAGVTVTVNALPVLAINTPPVLCIGNDVTLTVQNAVSYVWSPGTGLSATTGNSVIAKPLQTGSMEYTITGTDVNGCVGNTTVVVVAAPKIIPEISDSVVVCKDVMVTFIAGGGNKYLWSNGETTASITVMAEETKMYNVTISNTACFDTASVKLIVKNEVKPSLHIPNAFTPNGDKLNDVFMVVADGVLTEFQGAIYNRWGELYYEWSNITDGWDGKLNGNPVQEDCYIYKIHSRTECSKKEDNPITGIVTIIK